MGEATSRVGAPAACPAVICNLKPVKRSVGRAPSQPSTVSRSARQPDACTDMEPTAAADHARELPPPFEQQADSTARPTDHRSHASHEAIDEASTKALLLGALLRPLSRVEDVFGFRAAMERCPSARRTGRRGFSSTCRRRQSRQSSPAPTPLTGCSREWRDARIHLSAASTGTVQSAPPGAARARRAARSTPTTCRITRSKFHFP